FPSARRADRRRVSWTGFERMVYRLTPRAGLEWYFYRFLAQRLHARRFHASVLREKSWSQALV
ncbi:MAG: glycosyltransferase family 2 protein, partial [Steroidobacteraceae bacterium]